MATENKIGFTKVGSPILEPFSQTGNCGLMRFRGKDLIAHALECEGVVQARQTLEIAKEGVEGKLLSRIVEIPSGFDRAVPSWNIRRSKDSKAVVSFRVRSSSEGWSDWMDIEKGLENTGNGSWRWEVDQLVSQSLCSHFQFQVTMERTAQDSAGPSVESVHIATQNRRVVDLSCFQDRPETVSPIELPHLSQHAQDEVLGARWCGPTSLAMVLAGIGIGADAPGIAQDCYHPAHQIYGCWPLLVDAAHQRGASGWIEYIGNWDRATDYLRRRIPLICSIAFDDKRLESPPYEKTQGHLLALLGVDEEGRPITHDPNLPTEKGAYLKWEARDFARAWFGHGGVAIVLHRL